MSVGEGRPAQAPGDVLARSSALVADGRFDENLELLRRAAEDHRDDVDVVLRAAAAEQDADHARAAQLLERAVSLAPEDAGVLTRAGFGALALGDLDRALGWAERAGRLTVDDPDFPLAFDLGHLGGRIFVARGRDDLAERLLEIAFEELPRRSATGWSWRTCWRVTAVTRRRSRSSRRRSRSAPTIRSSQRSGYSSASTSTAPMSCPPAGPSRHPTTARPGREAAREVDRDAAIGTPATRTVSRTAARVSAAAFTMPPAGGAS